MEVELVQFQFSYLLDLGVVFDDVDLEALSSIASFEHGSKASAVSVSALAMGFFFCFYMSFTY